jgi:hypothetical protein
VHIYNAPVNADCSEMDISHKDFRKGNPSSMEILNSQDISLELQFNKYLRNSSMSVYPNPGTGYFTISYEGDSKSVKQIFLYDILGNKLMIESFSGNTFLMNLNAYPKGIYFIKLSDLTNTLNQKLIIQ